MPNRVLCAEAQIMDGQGHGAGVRQSACARVITTSSYRSFRVVELTRNYKLCVVSCSALLHRDILLLAESCSLYSCRPQECVCTVAWRAGLQHGLAGERGMGWAQDRQDTAPVVPHSLRWGRRVIGTHALHTTHRQLQLGQHTDKRHGREQRPSGSQPVEQKNDSRGRLIDWRSYRA